MKQAPAKAKSAFTLIEMLVVILIIAVLLCLLMPAIAAVRRMATKSQAASYAQHMANTIKQYRNAYSKYPGQTQGGTDRVYDNVTLNHSVLLNDLTNNPRKLYFSEVVECISDNTYLDPYRRPYVIAVDENNDGRVAFTCSFDTVTFSTSVLDRVAVFSWGRNPSNPADRVFSWVR